MKLIKSNSELNKSSIKFDFIITDKAKRITSSPESVLFLVYEYLEEILYEVVNRVKILITVKELNFKRVHLEKDNHQILSCYL